MAQIVNWAMTLATIRLLEPEDYGLMAVTMTITGFMSSLSTVGITDAVVQKAQVTAEDLRNVFGFLLIVNAGCLVVLCALAYPAAWFYGQPRLVALLQVASLLFVASAFQAVPRAVLDKQLDMKAVSRVEALAAIAGGALVLLLAWRGAGVWSLLAGPLLAAGLRAVGFALAARQFPLPRFRFATLSDIIRIGGLRTAEQVLWFFYTNCDFLIIGKLLGADIAGVYYVSRYLAAMPVDKFAVTLRPVAFPAFASVQHDRNEALHYLRKVMRLLAFTSFPVLLGLAATAPQVVFVALGPKWAAAATPVAILAMAMALRPVGLMIPPFLLGIGEFAASFRNTLFATILFPAAFAIGSYWGLIGVCLAWLIAFPIQLLSLVRRAALVSRTSIGSLLIPLLSPLVGSLIMYAVVRGTAAIMPATLGVWTTLMSLIAIGVLVYLGYTLIFLRPVALELIGLVKR
jgi:O-antigen/teichoic acid export membrane protein